MAMIIMVRLMDNLCTHHGEAYRQPAFQSSCGTSNGLCDNVHDSFFAEGNQRLGVRSGILSN
eukprot:9629325-Karenia_brevis.AAC.1